MGRFCIRWHSLCQGLSVLNPAKFQQVQRKCSSLVVLISQTVPRGERSVFRHVKNLQNRGTSDRKDTNRAFSTLYSASGYSCNSRLVESGACGWRSRLERKRVLEKWDARIYELARERLTRRRIAEEMGVMPYIAKNILRKERRRRDGTDGG